MPPFADTATLEADIKDLLSKPRFDAYATASKDGSTSAALDLYKWNLRVSAAFYESIHYLEVALRNREDTAISDWHDSNHTDTDPWYRCNRMPLNPEARYKIRKAIDFATMNGERPETHGSVVTELSFGFWRSLLADSYNRSLWQPILMPMFPTVRRGRLHQAIWVFVMLRNRISHGEPIHSRDLASDYQLLLKTAAYIHPSLRTWIETTSFIPIALQQRP
jgi:hypothetical protein